MRYLGDSQRPNLKSSDCLCHRLKGREMCFSEVLAAASTVRCLIRGKKSAWKRGSQEQIKRAAPQQTSLPPPLCFVLCSAGWRQTPAPSILSQLGAELQD